MVRSALELKLEGSLKNLSQHLYALNYERNAEQQNANICEPNMTGSCEVEEYLWEFILISLNPACYLLSSFVSLEDFHIPMDKKTLRKDMQLNPLSQEGRSRT